MQALRKLVHWLLSIGNQAGQDTELINRIRIFNLLSSILVLLGMGYTASFVFLSNTPFLTLSAMIGTTLCLLPLVFSSAGHFAIARWILFVNCVLNLSFFSYVLGLNSGIHNYLVACICFPFFFFSSKETRQIFFGVLFVILTLGLIAYFGNPTSPLFTISEQTYQSFRMSSVFLSMAIVAGSLFYFVRLNQRSEANLHQKIAEFEGEAARRVTAEKSALELGVKLSSLLNGIPDAVYEINRQFRIVYANETSEMLGGGPGSFINKNLLDILGAEDLVTAVRDISSVFEQKKIVSLERKVTLLPTGLSHYFSTTFSPIIETDGSVNYLVGISRDITSIRNAEIELKQAVESANSANQAKSAFLASMSHELRTPLGVIIGFSDLLQKPPLDEKLRIQWSQSIHRNALYLLNLINDLLDLSTIDAGRFKVNWQSTSPQIALNEAVELLESLAKAKGTQLVIAGRESVPELIHADPIRIRQILLNLIGNAIKFSNGKAITITASLLPASKQNPTVLRYSIRDQGSGMDHETKENLFRPFSGHRKTRKENSGTGLGLYLSRKLAVLMGGNVELAFSQVDQGSEFVFSIPVGKIPNDEDESRLSSADVSGNSPIAANSFKNFTVLILEDSLDNQVLLQGILRLSGLQLHFAATGREGLQFIATHQPDLVLMDIQLQDSTGYEISRQLRSEGYSKPIIAVTAFAMPDEESKCLDAGMNDFITKPLNHQVLLEKLSKWLGKIHQ